MIFCSNFAKVCSSDQKPYRKRSLIFLRESKNMNCYQQNMIAKGLNYVTSFDEKLLGVGCDVEVVVDIESGAARTNIQMRSFLRSTPAFRITLDDLVSISTAIQSVRKNVKLLESLISDATDHQLNYSFGGMTLIVVQPKGKNARFTLCIGSFSREGDIDTLTNKEILEAVNRVEGLQAQVVSKVSSSNL
jgi:hypothetical protein